jgi:hypothetical protein
MLVKVDYSQLLQKKMINFCISIYTIFFVILNPITLNFIFDDTFQGIFFTTSIIILDIIILISIYLTYKNQNKLEAMIVLISFISLLILVEVAGKNYLYKRNSILDQVFKQPVFFDDEIKNFRDKYYKCAQKKADFYSKLYFFSAPKNLNCDGWSTIKSQSGPWIRNTINYTNNSNKKNIWFFGGSTMYSGSSSDADTIPSIISKKINLDKKNYFVENFGVGGLDLHYEVSNFFNLLRFSKNKPELVIFYDGYNDIFNKLNHGGEFFIFNFSQSLIYDQNNFHKFIYYFSEFLSDYSVVFKNTLGKKIRRFNINRLNEKKNKYTLDEIAYDYIKSIEYANNIAEDHNINVYFFLQPAAFSRKNPLGIETKFHNSEKSDQARQIYKKIKNNIKIVNFYDISDVFDNYLDQYFYDYAHLSRKGNEIVSDKIYEVIKKSID